ncbi:MAG: hypothetical protein ABH882_06945 [Candidatus Omnitrophota bacterium]
MLTSKKQSIKLNQEEGEDLFNALRRIDEEKPNSDDVAKVKEMFRSPAFWEAGYALSACVLDYYIERIEKCKSQRLFIEAEARYIKEQLGYFSGNQLEKLIIDLILLRWVSVIYIENKLSILLTEEKRVFGPEVYWQKILIRNHNLYLRTIETLARVRKLNKGIAFQVNIATDGGQQVNVNETMQNKEI